jgi:hypothetical protein
LGRLLPSGSNLSGLSLQHAPLAASAFQQPAPSSPPSTPKRFLLIAQVVLALQLPFTLVPLIKATSSGRLMGAYRNSRLTEAAAWGAGAAVFGANVLLFAAQLAPGATFLPQVGAWAEWPRQGQTRGGRQARLVLGTGARTWGRL